MDTETEGHKTEKKHLKKTKSDRDGDRDRET